MTSRGLAAVLYYLGYVLLAAVNAGVFRGSVLSARRVTQVPAAGIPGVSAQYPRVTLCGVTPDVSKLWCKKKPATIHCGRVSRTASGTAAGAAVTHG